MDRQTALNVLNRVREKQATVNLAADLKARQTRELLNNLSKIGLLSAGGALAFRGTTGLMDMMSRRLDPPDETLSGQAVPVLVPKQKRAADEPSFAKTNPFTYGLMATGVGIGGAAGAYKLLDSILEGRRRQEMKSQVGDAKREFERVLRKQYSVHPDPEEVRTPRLKLASDIGKMLDKIFDKFEKVALFEGPMQAYGSYAALSSLLAAYAMYKNTSKYSDEEALNKAINRRDRRRQMVQPVDLYAEPVPTKNLG
jgi:hypothetical protein